MKETEHRIKGLADYMYLLASFHHPSRYACGLWWQSLRGAETVTYLY